MEEDVIVDIVVVFVKYGMSRFAELLSQDASYAKIMDTMLEYADCQEVSRVRKQVSGAPEKRNLRTEE